MDTIRFRKLKSIDKDAFRQDIVAALQPDIDAEPSDIAGTYDYALRTVLDKHACTRKNPNCCHQEQRKVV